MDYDDRLRKDGVENEPALGASGILWGYDDVRDEPALAGGAFDAPLDELSEEPALGERASLTDHGLRYRQKRQAVTHTAQLATLTLIAIGMVPLPLVGLFLSYVSGTALFRALTVTVLFPIVLELLKPVVGLAVVEGRPWLVPARVPLVAAHVLGGMGFGAVMYAMRDIGPLLFGLTYSPARLIAAVALHGTTALVSGLGVARVWKAVDVTGARPELRTMAPYLIGAVALHAAYGLTVWAIGDGTWAF